MNIISRSKWSYLLIMVVITVLSLPAGLIDSASGAANKPGPKIQPQRIGSIASSAHTGFQQMLKVQKMSPAEALKKQKGLLIKLPEVKQVDEQPGGNLFVRFKDGYEILMLLGEQTRGAAINLQPKTNLALPPTTTPPSTNQRGSGQVQSDISVPSSIYNNLQPGTSSNSPQTVVNPGLVTKIPAGSFKMPPFTPNSNKALLFDTLKDCPAEMLGLDYFIKAQLESLGYKVTERYNNDANLSQAAYIDNPGYGVVFISTHGGIYGGNFYFAVRPWYNYPPDMNSGYTGTIIVSCYNHSTGKTGFMYAVGKTFAQKYWQQTFPGTMFMLDTCDPNHPAGVNSLPAWTISRGASSWVGWDETVEFYVGDRGSMLLFNKLAVWTKLKDAVQGVYNAGYHPPTLKTYPADRGDFSLASWVTDINQPNIADGIDFKTLKVLRVGDSFEARVSFYAMPVVKKFHIYVDYNSDNKAEYEIIVTPEKFDVLKVSLMQAPMKIATGTPNIIGSDYYIDIPWSTMSLPAGKLNFMIYNEDSQEKLSLGAWATM
ncbi:MAG: hypothetical protein ACM3UZ_12700 [Acidobacteriota bacterium]